MESDAAEESPEDSEDEFDEEEDSPDEAEDEGDWDEPEFDDEGIEDELPEEEQSQEAEFEPIVEEKSDRLQKLKEKLKNHEKEQAKSAPKEKPKPKDEKKPEEKKPEPSVIEAPEDVDDTTGMNFVQKAQYRAKMRRRGADPSAARKCTPYTGRRRSDLSADDTVGICRAQAHGWLPRQSFLWPESRWEVRARHCRSACWRF